MLHAEKEIASTLINSALLRGWSVSVCDDGLESGGDWTVLRSTDFQTIFNALATTGSDLLVFRDGGKNKGCVVLVWGNDEDLIHDHSASLEMDEDGCIIHPEFA